MLCAIASAMTPPDVTFSISDLASEFGITTRTIRFYEEKGLLRPRREGTRRIYSPADRTRLRLILRGKRLGLSLDESAEIIHMYGTPGKNRRQLELLISRIEDRRATASSGRGPSAAPSTASQAEDRNIDPGDSEI